MSDTDDPLVRPVPTERFERVLAFALDEAEGLGHGYVTCQHLLYALSQESRGLARAVLDSSGVFPEALHELLSDTAALHDRTSQEQIDLAEETREVLDRAVSAARHWGHHTLDTEHLLYGILVAPTSADEMLAALRLDRRVVLDRLAALQQSEPYAAVREEATRAYRFTLESAWVLSWAVDAAQRCGAIQVGSLHLLTALIALPGPTQNLFVKHFGLSTDQVLSRLPRVLPSTRVARLPLAEETQRILGCAMGEAWNRGHLTIVPLHLAMGLARAGPHAALEVLADLGVSQADLIEALEAAMPPAVTR